MAIRDIRLAKLAFDIEANTKGLQGEIQSAERTFGRITKFIIANPVAAMGSLAAAALAAGVAATEMASAFDRSMRKIAAAIPQGTSRLAELKQAANDLAVREGLPSETVIAGLTAVAQEGVAGVGELVSRFELLQKAADATGTSVEELAGPFDQILDVFGLTVDDLERVEARLAAISQEQGVGFVDLIGAFQSAAPVIREAGLSFDEGSAAIGRLLAQGLNAKQATSELRTTLEQLGRNGMLPLASATRDAAKELEDLNRRQQLVRDGTERATTGLREVFSSFIRDIGEGIRLGIYDPLVASLGILTRMVEKKRDLDGAAFGNATQLAAAFARMETLAAGRAQPGGRRLPPPAPLTEDQRKKAQDFAEELHEILVRATATLDDDLQLVIDKFKARYREAARGLTAEQRQQFQLLLDGLEKAKAQQLTPEVLARTQSTPLALRGTSDQDLAKQAEDIAERTEREAKAAKEAADAREKARAAVRAQADALQRTARGAAQLAEAFGLLDRKAAEALESIVGIASELKVIAANGLSFDSALSVAGGFASLLSAFTGEDPEARAWREAMERNSEAIERLRSTIGEWLNISGRAAGAAREGLGALLADPAGLQVRIARTGALGATDPERLREALAAVGLKLGDLKDIAEELGVTLDTDNPARFVESLQALNDALAAAEITRFTETFAGQLDALRLQFELFDLDDPLEQLKRFVELASSEQFGSPALRTALAGLDLSDPAQRAEAERRLQDLFTGLTDGSITPEQLGLTLEEFIDAMRTIEAGIDAVNQASGTTTSAPGQTSFGVVSQATGVQVDRLIGLAVSQDGHLVEIRDLLAAFSPVHPPALPESLALGAAGGTMVLELGPITIEVHGAMTEEGAKATGRTLGLAAADALARTMGAQLTRKRLTMGDPTV